MKDVVTVGYEDAPLAAFLQTLRTAGVETIIDVRAVANSRKAGFAKKHLAASLADAGIAYRHIPQLGTPPMGREAARRGDIPSLQEIYGAHLRTPEAQAALIELARLARSTMACLLCLEANPCRCHRLQIADALRDGWGFTIKHLYPGGGWAPLPKKRRMRAD